LFDENASIRSSKCVQVAQIAAVPLWMGQVLIECQLWLWEVVLSQKHGRSVAQFIMACVLYDVAFGVGICIKDCLAGWLLLQMRVLGWWESGQRLACCRVVATWVSRSSRISVGLEGQFLVSKGVGEIGIGSLEYKYYFVC
jgi:hypothetical protein